MSDHLTTLRSKGLKPLNQYNWKKEQPEKMFGMCGIVKVKHGYEVGYWCHVNYTRKGYILEVVKTVLDYTVNTLHENKFLILAQSNNEASKAIAEKLGFVEKATEIFYSEQRHDWGEYRLIYFEKQMRL